MQDSLLTRLRKTPEDQLVEIFKGIHARKTRRKEATTPVPEPAEPPPESRQLHAADDPYERARQLFSKQEQQLRQQAKLADSVIEQLRAGRAEEAGESTPAPAPSQETLVLRAPLGAIAGGRFRLRNGFPVPSELRLEASPLCVAGRGDVVNSTLELHPSTFRLEPGQEQTVAVRVDLEGRSLADGDRLEASVRAKRNGETLHHLWVEIELYDLDPPFGAS